jgi:transcription antitermination factor NusG
MTWNALRTRSRQEKVVEGYLGLRNVEVFLPKTTQLRQWKRRRASVEVPLFSGYVFVKPKPEQLHILNFIPGSCGMVMDRNRPSIIREKEMEAIKIIVGASIPMDLHANLIPGIPVKVLSGPLQGIEGVLVRLRDQNRLVINAEMLGQAVSVEINRNYVVPISRI